MIYNVYRKNRKHDHDQLPDIHKAKQKVKEEIEKLIIELNNDYPPQTIWYKLSTNENVADADLPTKRQVDNIVQKYKKKNTWKQTSHNGTIDRVRKPKQKNS